MINRVKIEVLGSTYTVATPEDEQYVRTLARELDGQLKQLMDSDPRLSPASALILCAISYADSYRKSESSSDHMRAQLTEYLEEAARARNELESANRELEVLRRQVAKKQ
ncbi:MAG: cell division protein ZapA [Oscillospiraceae bacterium]